LLELAHPLAYCRFDFPGCFHGDLKIKPAAH
jgi:hypothetical protein